jgi:hypothetical protein
VVIFPAGHQTVPLGQPLYGGGFPGTGGAGDEIYMLQLMLQDVVCDLQIITPRV